MQCGKGECHRMHGISVLLGISSELSPSNIPYSPWACSYLFLCSVDVACKCGEKGVFDLIEHVDMNLYKPSGAFNSVIACILCFRAKLSSCGESGGCPVMWFCMWMRARVGIFLRARTHAYLNVFCIGVRMGQHQVGC